MSRLRARVVGSGVARCRRCDELATLTVHESRYVRSWTQLLNRTFDAAVSRTASCSACGRTYPIRSTDRTPEKAGRRQSSGGAHAAGRDWSYR